MPRPFRSGSAGFRIMLVGGAAGAVVLGGAVSPAMAARAQVQRPTVKLKFENARISHTQRPVVEYSSANLPSRTTLELQRQFGSRHVWRNVMTLPGHSGRQDAPKVQMGRYAYRIQAIHRQKVIADSATETLYSYALVPLANLCNDNNSNVTVNDTNSCDTSTVQVGGTVFTYLIQDDPPPSPQYDQDVTVAARTSCRSIHLQWALDNNAGTSDTAQVEVVQASADPQSASPPEGQIGSKSFTLDGGPWDLNLSASNFDAEYVNASLSCWSASGLT